MSKQSNLKILLNGIIKENPVLVLILGTCPTLAVTSLAVNGLGHGPGRYGGAVGFQYCNFAVEKSDSG